MERLAVLQAGLHDLRSLDKHRLSSQSKSRHRIPVELVYIYLPVEGCSPGADGPHLDTKPRDGLTVENSASQTEVTPGESLAEVTVEHSPAPDSGYEVSEEVPPETDAIPDTSHSWGFTSTRKKGQKAKRPAYDWD